MRWSASVRWLISSGRICGSRTGTFPRGSPGPYPKMTHINWNSAPSAVRGGECRQRRRCRLNVIAARPSSSAGAVTPAQVEAGFGYVAMMQTKNDGGYESEANAIGRIAGRTGRREQRVSQKPRRRIDMDHARRQPAGNERALTAKAYVVPVTILANNCKCLPRSCHADPKSIGSSAFAQIHSVLYRDLKHRLCHDINCRRPHLAARYVSGMKLLDCINCIVYTDAGFGAKFRNQQLHSLTVVLRFTGRVKAPQH